MIRSGPTRTDLNFVRHLYRPPTRPPSSVAFVCCCLRCAIVRWLPRIPVEIVLNRRVAFEKMHFPAKWIDNFVKGKLDFDFSTLSFCLNITDLHMAACPLHSLAFLACGSTVDEF